MRSLFFGCRFKFLQNILLRPDGSAFRVYTRFIANVHCVTGCCKYSTRVSCSKMFQNNYAFWNFTNRNFSTKEPEKPTGKEIDVSRENPYAGLSAGEKVKEASKDLTYLLIIVGGIAVIGVMFYTLGKELFSKQSPGGVYSEALKVCKKNDEVIDVLGEPIVGHGTSGGRRRRQHVNAQEFMVNGVKHMRLQFYINGPYRKGTVHVEVYQDENKKYQYKYLIVELDGYPAKTIVIENNR